MSQPNGSSNDDDPFLSVQSDVLALLTTTRTLFSSYLRIRALSSSSTSYTTTANKPISPELLQSRSDLLQNLSTLTSDLADLLDSIAAVESDPYTFGLDVAEVSRRREFVVDVGKEVEGMRTEVEDIGADVTRNPTDTSTQRTRSDHDRIHTTNNTATGRNRPADDLPPPSAFAASHHGSHYASDDDEPYRHSSPNHEDIDYDAQHQTQILHDQDEIVTDVFDTVGRLRGQAETMGRELEDQSGMIDDVDKLADRVGGKLQGGLRKVGEVIRRNEDGVSSCCIGVLVVVLVLLLVLVIAL